MVSPRRITLAPAGSGAVRRGSPIQGMVTVMCARGCATLARARLGSRGLGAELRHVQITPAAVDERDGHHARAPVDADDAEGLLAARG